VKRWGEIALLLVIPIFVVGLSLLIKHESGPGWIGYKYDPDYVYLLNSLNLTQGKIPGHFDHPGTPLQMLGAGVIVTLHLTRTGNLAMDVLTNPEIYLETISLIISLLVFGSLFLVGFLTMKLTKSRFYALIIQLTPLLSSQIILHLHRVSPEPILFIACLWFAYMILHLYINHDKANKTALFLLALITGLALATKLNSLTFIIIPLIILTKKQKISYVLSTIGWTVIFTLPIISLYSKIGIWIYQLLIHSGTYGRGAATVINFNNIIHYMGNIIVNEPFLSVVIITNMILLTKTYRKTESKDIYKFTFGSTLFLVFTGLLVAKMGYMRYLVPCLGLLGLTVIFILIVFKKNIFIVTGLILVIIFNLNKAILAGITPSVNLTEYQKIQNSIKQQYSDYLTVDYYGASTQPAALYFANLYVNNTYSRQLAQIYPGYQYFYLGNSNTLPTSKKVLLRGVPFTRDYAKFRPDLVLEDVFHGQTETLYYYHP